jgi:hypothetical protein
MPTFIKTGFWEKKVKGFRDWLNLDDLITSVVKNNTSFSIAASNDVVIQDSYTYSNNVTSAINIDIGGNGSNYTEVSFPNLTYIDQSFYNNNNPNDFINLPKLESLGINGDLTLSCYSFNLDSLKTTSGLTISNFTGNVINLPSLIHSYDYLQINGSPLTVINIPNLVSCSSLYFNNNESLVNFTLPSSFVIANNDLISLTDCALSQASVDGILAICAASGATNLNISLQNGTSATPSAQGLLYIDIIVANGGTVRYN